MIIMFKEQSDESFETDSHMCIKRFSTKFGDIIISVPIDADEHSNVDISVEKLFSLFSK